MERPCSSPKSQTAKLNESQEGQESPRPLVGLSKVVSMGSPNSELDDLTHPKTKKEVRKSLRRRHEINRLKRDPDLPFEKLQENILGIGARLQKRKPEITNSDEDDGGSSALNSPTKIAKFSGIKVCLKTKDQTSISTLRLKDKNKHIKVFPCYLDSQIYNRQKEFEFSRKLTKTKDRDYDVESGSEDLEAAQKKAFLSLKDALKQYRPQSFKQSKSKENKNGDDLDLASTEEVTRNHTPSSTKEA